MYFYSILSGIRSSAWDGFSFIVNDRLKEPKNLKNLMKPLKKLKEPVKCRRNVQNPEAT